MTLSPASTPSPCVRVCVLDPAAALCIGCGRTLDEIAAWSTLSDEARLTIMDELDARMSRRPDEGL